MIDLSAISPLVVVAGTALWYGGSKFLDSELKTPGGINFENFDTNKFLATLCVSLAIGLYTWQAGIELNEVTFGMIFVSQVGAISIVERIFKLLFHWINKKQEPTDGYTIRS